MSELHNASAIQRSLAHALDRQKLNRLSTRMQANGAQEDVRRLADLRDIKHQDHSWWKSLDPETDRVLLANEWIIAMRARLGAPILLADSICGRCGDHIMDVKGYHALCC